MERDQKCSGSSQCPVRGTGSGMVQRLLTQRSYLGVQCPLVASLGASSC